MLRSLKDIDNSAIDATDGTIGHVKDFYFDDASWTIRYLIVETGSWLSSRRVLISPISVSDPPWADKTLPVGITTEQVKNSPDIDTHMPVSRQHEVEYFAYYGYPFYWEGGALWGEGAYPNLLFPGYATFATSTARQIKAEREFEKAQQARHRNDDPHLRSCAAVAGSDIHAIDGDIGHVEGYLVDEETWAIRYLIVNTSNWWLGHKVLVAPRWIQAVSWEQARVTVNMSRQEIKDAPPYDPAIGLDRAQEMSMHSHYGRPGYWIDEIPVKVQAVETIR